LGAAEGTAAIEGFAQKVHALSPQTDTQRALQSRALEIVDSVAQARWMEIEEEENAIPTPFLVVLVLWLAVMFVSFGLFAPRNAIAVTVLFLGALSLSGAIFLIEELNNPLGGFIAISRAPMDRALGFIGN
jgi:protein-S-isoprenylcysteine O-methyltransferase Ste14